MQDVFAKYLVLTVEVALFTRIKVLMVYSDNVNTGTSIFNTHFSSTATSLVLLLQLFVT